MNNDTVGDVGFRVDAWLPREMAQRPESVGVNKASLDFWTMLALGILAGAFIGLGAVFATTITASPLPYGVKPADRGIGVLPGTRTGCRGGRRAL